MTSILAYIDAWTSSFYGFSEFEVQTQLQPGRAARRLRRLTNDGAGWLSEGIVGDVDERSVVLTRKRRFVKNPYKPVLRAEIDETPNGSVVRGRFTLRRSALFGSAFFVLLMLGFGVNGFVDAVTAGRHIDGVWFFLGFAVAAATGCVFFLMNMRAGRVDARVIRTRVANAVRRSG
jgi:hypothetical protein